MNVCWRRRQHGSTWRDRGADDQRGRFILIGHEQVRTAVAEVTEGRTFCLSLRLGYPGGNVMSPVRFPPRLRAVVSNDAPYYNYEWQQLDLRLTDIACDDVVEPLTQHSTQWDRQAHRGALFDADGVPEPFYDLFGLRSCDQRLP